MLHFKCGEVAISGVYFGELLHTFSFILDIFLYFSLFLLLLFSEYLYIATCVFYSIFCILHFFVHILVI